MIWRGNSNNRLYKVERKKSEMVYTDGIHLVADTLDELHAFALKIGLKRDWFQYRGYPHYDLMGGMTRKAIDAGAKTRNCREILAIAQGLRKGDE